jgi:hypothetical protein
MSGATAVGEIFYAAFRALPPAQKESVLERLLRDRELKQDLFDLALIERGKRIKGRGIEARAYFGRSRAKTSR